MEFKLYLELAYRGLKLFAGIFILMAPSMYFHQSDANHWLVLIYVPFILFFLNKDINRKTIGDESAGNIFMVLFISFLFSLLVTFFPGIVGTGPDVPCPYSEGC